TRFSRDWSSDVCSSDLAASPEKPARTPGQEIRPEHIKRWGPAWSRRVGWFLAKVVWRTTVIGAENVPRTGRVLLAANHTGIIDEIGRASCRERVESAAA